MTDNNVANINGNPTQETIVNPDQVNARFGVFAQQYNLLTSMIHNLNIEPALLDLILKQFYLSFLLAKEGFNSVLARVQKTTQTNAENIQGYEPFDAT